MERFVTLQPLVNNGQIPKTPIIENMEGKTPGGRSRKRWEDSVPTYTRDVGYGRMEVLHH